jgi:nicotinate-nucleotide--dimethylbenzimidazole phosphoribosyltransferase
MATARFRSIDDIHQCLDDLPAADSEVLAAARARNAALTKPPGALGRLEDLAIWYAGWRRNPRPTLTRPQIVVFAGNHGVAALGVSAFPAEVTAQMVANFQSGGAAINQLAATFGASMEVVPLTLNRPTADFTRSPAMTTSEFCRAFAKGWRSVNPDADLFVAGEMGIANTTSAAAVAAALFGGGAEGWVGRGTGVDDAGLARKRDVVDAGLACHAAAVADPLEALRCLGGREMAAIAGAILRARIERIPVILDGFIATASAAALQCAASHALDHAVAGHLSEEGAHGRLLSDLGKEPILSLGLRLGEGSGAALAIGVLKAAVACHSGMASFDEAGVSDAG